MKLYYDRKSKDPIYYIQKGYRIGKKTTTKNVRRIGKHSELLAVTDDPLAYAKEQVRLANEKEKAGRQEMLLHPDFDERLDCDAEGAVPTLDVFNVGYVYLQHLYSKIGYVEEEEQRTRFQVFDRILQQQNRFYGAPSDAKIGTCSQEEQIEDRAQQVLEILVDLVNRGRFSCTKEELATTMNHMVKKGMSPCTAAPGL